MSMALSLGVGLKGFQRESAAAEIVLAQVVSNLEEGGFAAKERLGMVSIDKGGDSLRVGAVELAVSVLDGEEVHGVI